MTETHKMDCCTSPTTNRELGGIAGERTAFSVAVTAAPLLSFASVFSCDKFLLFMIKLSLVSLFFDVQQIDKAHLQRVRILKLVYHQMAKTALVAGAYYGRFEQQAQSLLL